MEAIDIVIKSVKEKRDQLIKDLAEFSDAEIKELILEFQQLQDSGMLPDVSKYRELTIRICSIFGLSFDIKMTESFLNNEIMRRFVANEKEFTAEETEEMAIEFGLLAADKKLDGSWRDQFRTLVMAKYRNKQKKK